MVSHRDSILADQGTLNESLNNIRLLCEGICLRLIEANEVAEWQGRAHDANMAIHTHMQNIQELQDEVNQMCIRSNEELEEREGLKTQLTSLQNAANNERTANEKVKSLEEEIGRLRGMLDNRDTAITKSSENLEAIQEELRAQTRVLERKEEQIRNENEKHREAIELNAQQHKQAIFQVVSETTKECREKCQATEKQLQEAVSARGELECELAELRQEMEISGQENIDEDLGNIRGELVELITSMTGLTTGLQESEHEREALQRSLEKWTRDRGEIGQMRNLLGRLARDQPNAIKMSEQLRELLEIQKKLTGTLEYHQAGLANSGVAVGLSESQRNGEMSHSETDLSVVVGKQNSFVHAQEELRSLRRKVVVKSPANDDDPALPMSVEQERCTRRQIVPTRGIMKTISRGTLREEEAGGSALAVDVQRPTAPQPSTNRRIAKRGSKPFLTTHSMYNRPVAGSISRVDNKQGDASQSGSTEYGNDENTDNNTSSVGDSDRIVGTGNVDETARKRQRTNGAHSGQKVKLSHSMSTPFLAKSEGLEPQEIPPEPKTPSLAGGPIKRRQSDLVTYSSQGLGMKRSHSQSSIGSSQTMKLTDGQD
ncbi:hypothetical protein F4805DRAFT_113672 [Annulohypoxylon moriforme]|nr:hypothetical protein F4805DRAFT_113672 [Annulohypoxylon moriforme]